MRVTGVICEYNPFHNGHAHHLRLTREMTGCDYIVCVMSGAFTQRGEAAIVSKWARAEMALRGGADAVFELPTLFAVRDAERFARGGVALLDALGVVTHLSFGSESGDLETLQSMAAIEVDLTAIRAGLAQGMTLARARGEATGMAASPNDTLAVEYLRALRLQQSTMTPVTVARKGGGYHDATPQPYASATAIRASLREGRDVLGMMPGAAYALLQRLLAQAIVQGPDGLDQALLYRLRTMDSIALAQIADVSEGLENRLLRAAQKATSRDALLADVKCKRYTWARLSRILTQTLLGITKAHVAQVPLPSYARLLGFRRDAQPLLSAIQASSCLPIVTRAAKFRPEGDAAFALDLRAADVWSLGLTNPALRNGAKDLTENIRIIE